MEKCPIKAHFNEDFKDHVYASFRALVCAKSALGKGLGKGFSRLIAFFLGGDHLTCEMRGDLRVRNEMF